MCDTMCIMADRSGDGIAYFAKNSDRSPNEPHLVIHVPGMRREKGSSVRCTYISIPQAEYTREMVLCKPSWIWGAEMGVNESRVAIGNEAVFTKSKKGPPALLGMDMLRLALERSDSAASAVETLIYLLEQFGQGGNCGYDHAFFYDNSFLAADPKEAFIMETSGRNYAVKKVEGYGAISNRLTIGKDHTRGAGIKVGEDFAKRYTEPVYSHFSAAKDRRRMVCEKLKYPSGTDGISMDGNAAGLIDILRSHNPRIRGDEFARGSVDSVCMHAGGLIGDHTTGSMAAVLRPEMPVTLWCTGASTPCISAFKPVFWPGRIASATAPATFPAIAPVFEDPEQSEKYWLQRERLHRAVIAGKVNAASLREKIYAMEKDWLAEERRIINEDGGDAGLLSALSARAAAEEQRVINEFYTEEWRSITGKGRYGRYWNGKNREMKQDFLKWPHGNEKGQNGVFYGDYNSQGD